MATTIPFMIGGMVFQNSTATAFNASGVAWAGVFIAQKTGTIDRIVIRCSALTGTSPTYDARIETISAGQPSNTLWATNTNVTFQATASTTHTLTLTASASVTRGDIYAVVIKYSSGTIDASNNATFVTNNVSVTACNGVFNQPAIASSANSGTTYSRTSDALPSFFALYSDGEAGVNSAGVLASASSNLNTSLITDIGCRFTAPANCSLIGGFIAPAIAASNIPTLTLYDLSSSTLATKITVQTVQTGAMFWFASPYSLTDGTDYYLTLASGSSTNLGIIRWQFLSDAARKACCGDAWYTSRTGSTWTDLTNFGPAVLPIFGSPVSSGGGGGSLAFNPVVRLP